MAPGFGTARPSGSAGRRTADRRLDAPGAGLGSRNRGTGCSRCSAAVGAAWKPPGRPCGRRWRAFQFRRASVQSKGHPAYPISPGQTARPLGPQWPRVFPASPSASAPGPGPAPPDGPFWRGWPRPAWCAPIPRQRRLSDGLAPREAAKIMILYRRFPGPAVRPGAGLAATPPAPGPGPPGAREGLGRPPGGLRPAGTGGFAFHLTLAGNGPDAASCGN